MKPALPSILIVEDVKEMLDLLKQMVEDLNIAPTIGVQSLAQARIHFERTRPKLILLDEIFPGESSHDFLSEVAPSGTPVILMTGMHTPPLHLPNGAALRLVKPGWARFEEDQIRLHQAIISILK